MGICLGQIFRKISSYFPKLIKNEYSEILDLIFDNQYTTLFQIEFIHSLNSNWPNNQMTQMPQTGANMQGTPNGLFQFQEGNDTMVMRQEGMRKHGYRMVKYKVVNGGNAGPILVNVDNPNIGKDEKDRTGEVYPTCGKGILLIYMECARENSLRATCVIFIPFVCCYFLPVISWPFVTGFCCYLRNGKKRLYTSCSGEFSNIWCLTATHK